MNYLWVVPYAGRNPPVGLTPSKGAHNTCRFERTGELPPRGGQHRCSSLPCSLWVVPYAGRNPPMLVGRALCRAEPSHACGSCPMTGGTLHDLCGARASGKATSDGSCSRHMARVTDSPERAPHGRMS